MQYLRLFQHIFSLKSGRLFHQFTKYWDDRNAAETLRETVNSRRVLDTHKNTAEELKNENKILKKYPKQFYPIMFLHLNVCFLKKKKKSSP